MKQFQLEKTIFLLILITVILLLAKQPLLKHVITVSPQSNHDYLLYDDASSGGQTTTNLQVTNKEFKWQCELFKGNTKYPYCGFEIFLGKSLSHGIDLSRYNSIKVLLDYNGTAKTVRLALRNFNPVYSSVKDAASTKYHELDIPINHLNNDEEIALASFSVPTWWKLDKEIPLNLAGSEYNNIVLIDIQTGSDVTEGLHQFKLKKIELHGQWLSTENWYLGILFAWLLIGLFVLLIRLYNLKHQIIQSNEREKELRDLNKILDSRSKELVILNKKDKLTGALNRQGVEDAIARGLSDWKNDGKPLSIIMLDIDHFKQINDTFGHDVGDNVLVALTQLVKGNIRSTDRFARWGGEEFVLICRNTPLDKALILAEHIRASIAASTMISERKITASFGVADIKHCGSIQKLFKQADKALYLAKNNGRNKVELADN